MRLVEAAAKQLGTATVDALSYSHTVVHYICNGAKRSPV